MAVRTGSWDRILVARDDVNDGPVARHIARHDPARVLREVEAKRRIVDRCSRIKDEPDEYPNGLVSPRAIMARQTLADMTLPYSGHPDYRPEWKP